MTDAQRLCGRRLLHEAEGPRTEDGSLAAVPAVAPTAGSGVNRFRLVVGTEFRAGPHGVSWFQTAVAVERTHIGFGVARHGELGALRHLVAREPAVVAGDGSLTWDRVALPGEQELKALHALPGAWPHVGLRVRVLISGWVLLGHCG